MPGTKRSLNLNTSVPQTQRHVSQPQPQPQPQPGTTTAMPPTYYNYNHPLSLPVYPVTTRMLVQPSQPTLPAAAPSVPAVQPAATPRHQHPLPAHPHPNPPSTASFLVSPTSQTHTASPHTSPVDHLMSMLIPVLNQHQQSSFARIAKIETAVTAQVKDAYDGFRADINGLRDELKANVKGHRDELKADLEGLRDEFNRTRDTFTELRGDSDARNKRAVAFFDKMFVTQQENQRFLGSKIALLEKHIGIINGDKSLVDRLDSIIYTVEDLLEREKDPEAFMDEPPIRCDAATSPIHQVYSDVCIGTSQFDSHVGAGTSPTKIIYRESAVEPRSPSPETPRCSIATGPVSLRYADAAIYQTPGKTLDFGTCPITTTHVDVAIASRTPEPSPEMLFNSASISSPIDTNHYSSRRSSDALTLVDDNSFPQDESLPQLWTSPEILEDQLEYGADMACTSLMPSIDSGPNPFAKERFNSVLPPFQLMPPTKWPIQEDTGNDSQVPDDEDMDDEVSQNQSNLTERISESPDVEELSPKPVVSPLIAASHELSPVPFIAPQHPASTPSPFIESFPTSHARKHDLPESTISDSEREEDQIVSSSPKFAAPASRESSCAPSPAPTYAPDAHMIKKVAAHQDDAGDSIVSDSEAESLLSVMQLVTTRGSLSVSPVKGVQRPAPSVPSPQPEQEQEEPSFFPQGSPLSGLTRSPVGLVSLPLSRSVTPIGAVEEAHTPRGCGEGIRRRIHRHPILGDELIFRPALSRSVSALTLAPTDPANVRNPEDPNKIRHQSVSLIATPAVTSPRSESQAQMSPTIQIPHIVNACSTSPLPRGPISIDSSPIDFVKTDSSPVYISSRASSPLSELSSEPDNDDDQESDGPVVIPAKRKLKREGKEDDRGALAPGRRLLSLVKAGGAQQSAATTRVKRKRRPSEKAMEPPLKRARAKLEKQGGGSGGSPGRKSMAKTGASGSGSPGKKRGQPRKLDVLGCKWPAIPKKGDLMFKRKFIECNLCNLWFHYGCVGIVPGDVRTIDGELCVCPPCHGGGANSIVAASNKANCSRPNCPWLNEVASNEYFVVGILGRATRVQSGHGRRYIWLMQWAGYPLTDCTWEDEESMNDPHLLIQEFNERATKEGVSNADDPDATILLKQAIEAGLREPGAVVASI